MDLSSGDRAQQGSGESEPGVDPVDEVCGVHAEMQEIRVRHAEGVAGAQERLRYMTCWRALALRRSPGRRPYLPRAFDGLLAEREQLMEDIRHERTRQEVEAIFQAAPEGETPTSGSSLPR